MEIEFGEKDLEVRYRSYREATRVWGKDLANAYVRRIGFLVSAPNARTIREARGLRMHALRGERSGHFAIDLIGRWRLIITLVEDTVRVEEVSNHYGD